MSLVHVLSIHLLLCVSTTWGLTALEISKFYNGVVINKTADTANYVFQSTGMPNHTTQMVNPNAATAQNYAEKIPKNPQMAANLTCVPMEIIGFSLNGVPYYNPYTGGGDNAVEGANKEIFDKCNGHPSPNGAYHYHQDPICVAKGTVDEFLGVALDGYPIYGPNASDVNRLLTNQDLDVCHGRTVNGLYRYHINTAFPYIIGCFKGTPLSRHGLIFAYDCSATKKNECCGCPTRAGRPGGAMQTAIISGALKALWGSFVMLFWINM